GCRLYGFKIHGCG
nr:Chain D, CK2beta-derived cyclic peptide [synthetic construct]4IB5_E Chain E, CK2beta-derived cyclic peptide [synthetic construct]4IB5_F Chain F, CK2beta-derived cyclic peptide [synthetic construct]4IB5_G Chain G, CK2beta-derived cyclic peptide [synthetic construct]